LKKYPAQTTQHSRSIVSTYVCNSLKCEAQPPNIMNNTAPYGTDIETPGTTVQWGRKYGTVAYSSTVLYEYYALHCINAIVVS
jgi:hypothetical protein